MAYSKKESFTGMLSVFGVQNFLVQSHPCRHEESKCQNGNSYKNGIKLRDSQFAFQQRRKTLRNSLKSLNLSDNLREDEVFNLRPEQLSVEQFIDLTQKIEADGI